MASFDNENIFAGGLADRATSLRGKPLTLEEQAKAEKDAYDIATRLAGSVGGLLSGSDIFNMMLDVGAGARKMLPEDAPSFLGGAYQVGPPIGNLETPLPPPEERFATTEYFQKMMGGDPQNPVSMLGDVLSMVTQPEVGVFKLAKFIGMFPFLKKIKNVDDQIQAVDTRVAFLQGQRRTDKLSQQKILEIDNEIFALKGAREELEALKKTQGITALPQFDIQKASKAEKQARIQDLVKQKNSATDPAQIEKITQEIKSISQAMKSKPQQIGLATLKESQRLAKEQQDRVKSLTVEENLGFNQIVPTIYEKELKSPIIESMVRAPSDLKGKQILEWASKNTKPKELEFTGLDNFIKNNPDATMDDAIRHVNKNQVRITEDRRVFDSSGPTLTFDVETARQDPISLSEMYDDDIGNVSYELSNQDVDTRSQAIKFLQEEGLINETGIRELEETANKVAQDSTMEGQLDSEQFFEAIKEYSGYEGDIDDLAEGIARMRYYEDPLEIIYPNVDGKTQAFGDTTFAIGRDDGSPYSIFVNGEYIEKAEPYSRTEAQIQLRDAIQSEQGTDIQISDTLRLEGEEYYDDVDHLGQSFQQYIDENLPGGDNYREITFNWDNATKPHDFGHSELNDQQKAIAHALVRDRKLADGTSTLHIDETQSNLHQKGAKEGYDTPEGESFMQDQIKAKKEQLQKELDTSAKPILQKFNDSFEENINKNFDEHMESLITNPEMKKKMIFYVDYVNPNMTRQEARSYYDNLPNRRKLGLMKEELDYSIRDYIRGMERNDYSPERKHQLHRNFMLDLRKKGLDDNRFISIADYDKLNDIEDPVKALHEVSSKSLVPNYPYKDDWHKMVLKKMILEAIQNGNEAISTSPAKLISDRYSYRYSDLYEILYDDKIPAEMKKLANKYGGEFEKGSLDLENTFGERGVLAMVDEPPYTDKEIAKTPANILRITPEMKEKILAEGLEKFKDGGLVSGINVFEENTAPRIDNMKRPDGTNKSAQGFLGPIKNQITGKTHTELSTNFGDVLDGRLIPLLVPTLTQEEIDWFRKNNAEGNVKIVPQSIKQKAIQHAIMRVESGKSPFYQDNESTLDNINIFKTMDR